jgi:hypothetical protein
MPIRAASIRATAKRGTWIALCATFALQTAAAQSANFKPSAAVKSAAVGSAVDATSSSGDVAKTLQTAAEALGLARWSGVGGQRLPEVDVINTMEIWGSGTTYGPGPASKPGEPGVAFKTEYHASLGYNPPAMRVELTRTAVASNAQSGAAPQHTIEVVREKYAWNESEIGAGLVPGKGTATAAMGAASARLLALWTLPYGVIKSAIAAGGKTKVSTANGATVITFPLSGMLSDVMVKATLDSQNEVASVETQTDNPAHADLNTETEYSDYADHGEILTDVKSPGHIVRKQGGHTVLDLKIKTLDANNPYLVFPVPANVKTASAQ